MQSRSIIEAQNQIFLKWSIFTVASTVVSTVKKLHFRNVGFGTLFYFLSIICSCISPWLCTLCIFWSDILFTVVQFTVPKKIYSLQFAVYSFKITTYSFVRVSQNINLKVKKVMLMPFVSSESAKRNCFNNNIVQEKAQFCWLKFITFRRPDYQNSLCTLNWNMVIKQVWGPSEKVHWLKTA